VGAVAVGRGIGCCRRNTPAVQRSALSTAPKAHRSKGAAAWHLRYAPVPNSLEPHLRPERTWYNSSQLGPPLRSGTKLALACSETSSHSAVLGVELEQPLKGRSCIQISQRIGGAANPGGSSGRKPCAVPPLTLCALGDRGCAVPCTRKKGQLRDASTVVSLKGRPCRASSGVRRPTRFGRRCAAPSPRAELQR
jgi:hypothetical protein